MDIISRLNEFVGQYKLSPSQFADKLGIPRPSASQILSGRNKKISNEFLGKLHQAFPDLDLMWLMFGEARTASSTRYTPRSEHTEQLDKQNPLGSDAPTLFDTQDSLPYHQGEEPQTNNEHAYESVIDDLKNTAPYLREIKTVNQSPKNVTPVYHTSDTEVTQAASVGSPAAQPSSPADTASTSPSTIQASKRIESIIVYYTDKTFEVFKPE